MKKHEGFIFCNDFDLKQKYWECAVCKEKFKYEPNTGSPGFICLHDSSIKFLSENDE